MYMSRTTHLWQTIYNISKNKIRPLAVGEFQLTWATEVMMIKPVFICHRKFRPEKHKSSQKVPILSCQKLIGQDVYLFATKADCSVNFCENRKIITHANIEAGMEFRAALTNNDCSGLGKLPAIELNTAILRIAISSVSSRTTCFFMSHNRIPVPKTTIYLQILSFH